MAKKVIEGSPAEVAGQLWESFFLPALAAVQGRPHAEIAQFYTGALSAAMGSMAADFGHDKALQIVEIVTESFKGMAGEFEPKNRH